MLLQNATAIDQDMAPVINEISCIVVPDFDSPDAFAFMPYGTGDHVIQLDETVELVLFCNVLEVSKDLLRC